MNNITKIEINEPIFEFKDSLYGSFDLSTTKINYIINKVEKGTALISLECSGFSIGKIQIPVDFISKLKDCRIYPAKFEYSKQ